MAEVQIDSKTLKRSIKDPCPACGEHGYNEDCADVWHWLCPRCDIEMEPLGGFMKICKLCGYEE